MASDDPSGTDVLIQPLVCRGGPVGVLEVEGPGAVIAARRRTLDAVAGLVAVVLRDSEGSRESLGLEPAGTRAPTRDLELGLMWTAHELRAPLLGAKAAIDRALMTSVDESDRRALLRESSAELLHLAESMEPLLRLAGGNASIDWRPTDLAAEVLESIEERAQDIDRHRLKIVSNASPTVRVNGDLVRHAVANIIINALKYSPPGTGVRVSVDEHAGVASVRVMNLGRPRIGASQHQTLFEPFVRGRPGAWSTSGLGLGLSIARRIVEVHGGVIWWRSSGDKTTFCIELPAEPTTEQARAREP
jgi:two-component system, OmpR family, sensor histidine kinase KdpD